MSMAHKSTLNSGLRAMEEVIKKSPGEEKINLIQKLASYSGTSRGRTGRVWSDDILLLHDTGERAKPHHLQGGTARQITLSAVLTEVYYYTKFMKSTSLYLGVRVSGQKKSGGCNTTFFPITFCSRLVRVQVTGKKYPNTVIRKIYTVATCIIHI